MEMAIALREAERLIITGCAPLLIFIGYRLFSRGLSRAMKLSGTGPNRWSIQLTNLTPGTFCFLLGVALGAYVMFSKVNYNSSPMQGERQANIARKDAGENGESWAGLGGVSVGTEPPSVQIRKAMSDFGFDVYFSADEAGIQEARQKLGRKLKTVPTTQKLKDMESLEVRARDGDRGAKETLDNWFGAMRP